MKTEEEHIRECVDIYNQACADAVAQIEEYDGFTFARISEVGGAAITPNVKHLASVDVGDWDSAKRAAQKLGEEKQQAILD